MGKDYLYTVSQVEKCNDHFFLRSCVHVSGCICVGVCVIAKMEA